MRRTITRLLLTFTILSPLAAQTPLTDYVNPFLGTAPLTDPAQIGYTPPRDWRVWAGLVFPGAALPNAMVQLTPITEFGSGAGYEYEDSVIEAFAHTCKGHWNLCHLPVLPVTGEVNPRDFGSGFSHEREAARPGYYQVFLERYGIDAELTTTLRCGFHRYTYPDDADRKLVFNLAVSNERVRDWAIEQDGEYALKGFQRASETVFFYATLNAPVERLDILENGRRDVPLVQLASEHAGPLELKIGLSFVSIENAKANLEQEIAGRSFDEVRADASDTWERLLSRVRVTGGTERQKRLFYSCLYRSFLWPALRSDANGEFTDADREVVNKGFRYYTNPSLWDTYRNKLVLLGMLSPEVTADVIQSMIDKGEKRGFMPTFFHGDHAAPFIAGSYLRGLRGFDVRKAYELLLRNATIEGGTRPYISEYMEKGYISTPVVERPRVETKAKAAVTKTLEYAYDDYALALLAGALGDEANERMLMARTGNYKNLFDPSTGLMRGRLESGEWVQDFNPQFPYYEYMYREANAWQSSFFAPHDVEGLIGLYGSPAAFEEKLDALFSIPWNERYIARNISCFIGQYCHGNQPDHNFPHLYYFVGKPDKSQALLNRIMEKFYGMGEDGLAFCGMDDTGEMSSWYVFNAIGLYTFSPADAEYLVTVPLFDRVDIRLGDGKAFSIVRGGDGSDLARIRCGEKELDGFFVSHQELIEGGELVITTR
jgi:predicted alpha-1,2-mannosidase